MDVMTMLRQHLILVRKVLTINPQILMIILSLNFIIKMKKEVQALRIYIKTKTIVMLSSHIQAFGN